MMIHIQPVVVQQFYMLVILRLHFDLFLHFLYIIPSVLFPLPVILLMRLFEF